MSPLRNLILVLLFAAVVTTMSSCAIPRAVGKTAGAVAKTAGRVVAGTAKAVTAPLR